MSADALAADRRLIQIVDAALAEAARLAGGWLACRPGCTQCCVGVFPINALDAARLRRGMIELEACDPARAAQVRERARGSVARLSEGFPGDPVSGILEEGGEAEARFDDFANDEPCPALDPTTGLCDLYASRPLPCRTFGPPLRMGENSVAVCELCFEGATDEEIAACEVRTEAVEIEASLVEQAGDRSRTLVAFALR